MGTRFFVLGLHTLGAALTLWALVWVCGRFGYGSLVPAACLLVGLYWLYSAVQIVRGRDALARKAEAFLNSQQGRK